VALLSPSCLDTKTFVTWTCAGYKNEKPSKAKHWNVLSSLEHKKFTET
jgi:hypothetical protein